MAWWEFVFMMFVLKIPIVYLYFVIRWAIKAEPEPGDGTAGDTGWSSGPPGWWRRPNARPGRSGPHGGPLRMPPRVRRGAVAHGRVER
jgi:hypothetical protein